MELFRYKAIDERGRIHRGRADAANAADLETRLSRLGLDLIDFRELRPGVSAAAPGFVART